VKALNIGCGERFHPEWTNLDLSFRHPRVRTYDLRRGIPEPDGVFDVVYHSHLLEHFDPRSGLALLRECCRVLRRGGIVRVAVPDLEQIATIYLRALDAALKGDTVWQQRYDWIMLELYDQTVRERTGGAMLEYVRQKHCPAEDFVIERLGGEARRMLPAVKGDGEAQAALPSLSDRAILKLRRTARWAGRRLVSLTLGHESLKALDLGRFRFRGEVHLWMYDRYSLARALKRAGFEGPVVRSAQESGIPNWCQYCLDTEPDGSIYKPDSFYMEALKP
jgi:predicted SAM-dependent methyltransferase